MPVAEPMQVRDAIRELPASRIAEISALGMGDPAVIALWYGEGDLATPDFIGAAATAALRAGHIPTRRACRSCGGRSPAT